MVFFILGLLLVAAGVVMLRDDRRLVRNGQRADAEVVGMQQTMRHGRRQPPSPIVRFRTADGREVETATKLGGNPPAARRGDRVRVIYQPGADGDVVIDNFNGRGLPAVIILSAIGLVLIAIGLSGMSPHSEFSSWVGSLAWGLSFGGGILAISVFVWRQDRRLARHGRQADAEVVDLVRERVSPNGGWAYYAVVRFRSPEGEDMETRVNTANSSLRPGNQVRIRYEIGYHEHAAIDTTTGHSPVNSLVIGAIFGLEVLAFAIFLLVR